MSLATSHASEVSLTSTLTLALTQCEDQVRQLTEQAKKVEGLTCENERLKQELNEYKSRTDADLESKYRIQFQRAFKQVAEKQCEIDRLKEKLRKAKTKAQRIGISELTTSTAISTSDAGPRSPYVPSLSVSKTAPNKIEGPTDFGHGENQPSPGAANKSREGLRGTNQPLREPLREVSGNTPLADATLNRKRKVAPRRQDLVDKAVAAIPELAEDGDDHLWKKPRRDTEYKTKSLSKSVYHRLENLLEAGVPASPVLQRARSGSPLPKAVTLPDATPARPSTSSFGLPTPGTDPRSERPRSSLTGSKTPVRLDPGDEEPCRSKPVSRLGLKDFKLNPAANEGLDFAYNQVVRGQERRCFPGCTKNCCSGAFRALADTLPNAQNLNGQFLSDHDLLLDYLGPGSEQRIRELTPKARENLIHDARTKLMANLYGKMHRNAHERGQSPPGFWRTDMPGTQEQQEDRRIAKDKEREEVEKRRREAMREGGRWIFADE